MIALGGDGTILGLVEQATQAKVPVLGVNVGKLGFLATYTPEQIQENFQEVLQGTYVVEKRTLLECQGANGQKVRALNDVVLKSGLSPRLQDMSITSQKGLVARVVGDGVIFCTPTGSTAYNLSAGGPIIQPSAPVFCMTPICPHTLSSRSSVLQENEVLQIQTGHSQPEVHLFVDGRLLEGFTFPLTLKISDTVFQLICPRSHYYFQALKAKIGWLAPH